MTDRTSAGGRTAALVKAKRNEKIRLGAVVAVLLAAVLCCSVAFAAPTRTDQPEAAQLEALKRINSAFGQAYDSGERFVGGEKNSVELCNFADKARNEGWNYVYGGKGQQMTPALVSSIISWNMDAGSPYLRNGYIGSTLRQVGNRATDCSGLVMTFMWWAGDQSDPIRALCPSIGGYNANAMLDVAQERGPMSTLPEIPGVLVHKNGHVGIYVGNGEVIEARGVQFGVTRTTLAERDWSYWSKSPWIDYELSGVYDIAGRRVFLDNGEDIGEERWVAKYVYGDWTAGSTYVPVYDPTATYGGSGSGVTTVEIDTETAADAAAAAAAAQAIAQQPEMTLTERILAVLGTLPYDANHGYFYEGHWYVLQRDAQGVQTAVLNDPAAAQPGVTAAPSQTAPSTDASGTAQQPEPEVVQVPGGIPNPIQITGSVQEEAPQVPMPVPDPAPEDTGESAEPVPASADEPIVVEGSLTELVE